jgi:hypothetical protein
MIKNVSVAAARNGEHECWGIRNVPRVHSAWSFTMAAQILEELTDILWILDSRRWRGSFTGLVH